jgi:predicted glycosyltransferase
MKIWFDACTGKHVRLGAAVGKRLRNLGYDVLLTTRQHPDTLPIAKLIGEEFEAVGKYDPTSLLSMLKQSAQRQLMFCEMFEKRRPDLAVAHGSVELCRVAFGLNIPVVSVHDTPHNEVVKRLTLPLIDFLVVSQAIPAQHWQNYGVRSIIQFNGVDEVAWIRNYERSLGVEYKKPLIVVRQFEAKAAYGKAKTDIMEKLAIKLTSLGEVVFLPRYDRHPRDGLIVPQRFLDSVVLVKHADLVVTVGGTISREAALQGTPSLVVPINRIGRGAVNDYLSRKGFPLYRVTASEVLNYAKKYIGKTKDVTNLLSKLEDPVSKIEKIVEEEKRK